ncbi:hypothetical protein [Cryobacterium zhongshanensis]|uniref:DUF4870 domain-containing protein n=1 Tax=Cryobacterium zhongshanensis TaxID=2928153 RepID=A0AA41QX49_9MICO|nr:hypothetical protein [Cryobacterium zhongshanensis]MCI4658902.1 hypothetical protein [Cryobacterium zhongshanensis]
MDTIDAPIGEWSMRCGVTRIELTMTSLPPDYQTLQYSPAANASGRRFWGIGFLWFVPFLGAVLAPILLGVFAAQNRRRPDALVRENSRWAANWAITVTLVAAIGAALVVSNGIVGLVLTGDIRTSGGMSPLLLVADLLIWAAWIAHLIVSIVGVASADTLVVNPKIAIPFIPAAR